MYQARIIAVRTCFGRRIHQPLRPARRLGPLSQGFLAALLPVCFEVALFAHSDTAIFALQDASIQTNFATRASLSLFHLFAIFDDTTHIDVFVESDERKQCRQRKRTQSRS